MFTSVSDVEETNRAKGYHFFDADALRFFHSIVYYQLIGGRYFITSECFAPTTGPANPRRFTIRKANDDGTINRVGEFQAFKTRAAAIREAYRLAEVTR